MIDKKRTLAHYKGLLAAAQDQSAMRGSGGGRPPRKGCLGVLVLVAIANGATLATVYAGLHWLEVL